MSNGGRHATIPHSELVCNICCDIPRDCIFMCQNGHDICRQCHHELPAPKVCPVGKCGFPRNDLRNLKWESIIRHANHLQLSCQNKFRGCLQKGTNRQLTLHELVCPFKVVACEEKECYQSYSRVDRLNHYQLYHQACLYRWQGCHFRGGTGTLRDHEEHCHYRPVPCPKVGCSTGVAYWMVHNHISTKHSLIDLGMSEEPWSNHQREFNLVWNFWNRIDSTEADEINPNPVMGFSTPFGHFFFVAQEIGEGDLIFWISVYKSRIPLEQLKAALKIKGPKEQKELHDLPVFHIRHSRASIFEAPRILVWRKSELKELSHTVSKKSSKFVYGCHRELRIDFVLKQCPPHIVGGPINLSSSVP